MTTAEDPLQAEVDEAKRACNRWLSWPGPQRPRVAMAALLEGLGGDAPDPDPDRYGEGGPVAELEAEVAELLGKPAAVFMPSGTMAQQIALRIWAERSGHRSVAYHPTSHLEIHEERGYAHLHGLVARLVGDRRAALTRADLDEVAEPLCALLLELPQREIGGILPAWDELVAQTAWARERGVALHLDGARLWECLPAYGRSASEVAGLFDTVYVSFYKGLGGLAGAALAGPDDVVTEARVWLRRHGGNLVVLWPYALAALHGLRTMPQRMPAFLDHARGLAAALRGVDGVEVLVDPPQVPMLHVRVRASLDDVRRGTLAVAREQLLALPGSSASESPQWRLLEISVGESSLAVPVAEAVAALRRLLPAAP